MDAIILNDLHIGVKRTGGTTPRSAFALRQWLRDQTEDFLAGYLDQHLVINGDLFDGFEVETSELISTVNILDRWINQSKGNLYLGGGNHDFSAKGHKVSSFQLLCTILKLAHPEKVYYYMNGLECMWNDKMWIIPHCLNQNLFDMELDRALEEVPSGSTLFLHCNYDNKFAVHSDHSLNLSQEKSVELNDAGIRLVIAHEHNKRTLRKEQVYITGNQFPTSVSDCLDPNEAKFAHIISKEGNISPIQTWTNVGGFKQVEWTNLNEVDDELFVRVEGSTTQLSASETLDAIAKHRANSQAFVITNAVKVAGTDDMEGFEVSLEEIKGFDVAASLLEKLEPEEKNIIEKILGTRYEN